jgi:hypothetical protein
MFGSKNKEEDPTAGMSREVLLAFCLILQENELCVCLLPPLRKSQRRHLRQCSVAATSRMGTETEERYEEVEVSATRTRANALDLPHDAMAALAMSAERKYFRKFLHRLTH